jgi:hypothetical protein
MKTVETSITVHPGGQATLEFGLPSDVPAGIHRAVIVIEENAVGPSPSREPFKFTTHAVGPGPASSMYRREEMYGDDGR